MADKKNRVQVAVWDNGWVRPYNPKHDELYPPSLGGVGGEVGLPSDGTWADGAAPIEPTDSVADAIDKVNETLGLLLPTPPLPLDGTDLQLTISTASGYIADGTNLGSLSAGSSFNRIINTNSGAAKTVNTDRFDKADQGSLVAVVDEAEVDSFDLAAHFNEAERDGCQSYPPATSTNGWITVNSVCKYNDFPNYQKGAAQINLNSLSQGYHTIQLKHVIGEETQSTNALSIFYDSNPGRPSISNLTVNIQSAGGTKYLSGVKYFTSGDQIIVSCDGNDIFNETYVDKPVVIDTAAAGGPVVEVSWNDSHASGYSTPPRYDDPWSLSNYVVTIGSNSVCTDVLTVGVHARDPFGDGSPVNHTQNHVLINTYTAAADDLHEYFVDELYRLPVGNYNSIPPVITGQWDSTQLLGSQDLQVYCHKLIYPSVDFTSGWLPSGQTANYSGCSGTRYYFRAFRQSGSPHSSGTLSISGITFSQLGSQLKLELKLPGKTGWLDLSKWYNPATFTGSDGDGCLTNHTQSGSTLLLDWTVGTFSTSQSGYMYILRVTYLTTSPQISYIAEVGW